jgi:hypothetical protein
MRVDTEESLKNGDKNRTMKDGIWRQLPELNAVGEQKTTKKFVGWKG